jgi:4-amino-4-deoxy-L-arabinose transferase-like glycosyltransferase
LEQPIWEGLDEWAHFAYIQNLVEQGRIPVPGDDTSVEVAQSLHYLPLPYQPGGRIPSELTHDQYWQLPASERAAREAGLRQIPAAARWEIGGAGLYEAQQAPLYYLLMIPVYGSFRHASLAARLLAVRIASVLIASLLIPLIYANGRELFGSDRMAMLLACLAASLPGLLMDVSRAGNESLAVVLGAAMTFVLVRAIRRGAGLREWLALGLILGLGLLTKAYFLAFLPIIPILGLALGWRTRAWRREMTGAALALLVAIGMGAAWYARMERLTGSLSGEKNAAAIAQQGLGAKLAAAAHINWLRIVYEQVYSQIWLGGWSFLRVRPWMYAVFEVLGLLCAAGLGYYALRRLKRRRITAMSGALAMLLMVLILFEPGLFYQALAVYMTTHEAFGPGWYFYVVLAPELLLLAAGAWALLGRRGSARLAGAATLLALALNLYTMHFLLLPYYTGLIAHAANGTFRAAHIQALFAEIRLSQLSRSPFVGTSIIPPVIFAGLWTAYVLGALIPAFLAVRISYFSGKARHK